MTGLPPPPRELAEYVGDRLRADPVGSFLGAGQVLGRQLAEAVPSGLDVGDGRILDFGCGAGRVLRYVLKHATAARIEGCDIDAACIDWLSAHLPPPHEVFHIADRPPLPRPAGHYRLVYASSVFSHLTTTWADWLCELHRVLEPGGLLAASVISAGHAADFDEEPWDDRRIGMLVLGPGNPWSHGGPMVLHSEWWLRARWGRAFEIAAVAAPFGSAPPARAQTLFVMRRRDVAITPAALLEPEPGEPRELTALAHALDRALAESAAINAGHDAYAAAYVAEVRSTAALRAQVVGLQAELTHLNAACDRANEQLAEARRGPVAAKAAARAAARRLRAGLRR